MIEKWEAVQAFARYFEERAKLREQQASEVWILLPHTPGCTGGRCVCGGMFCQYTSDRVRRILANSLLREAGHCERLCRLYEALDNTERSVVGTGSLVKIEGIERFARNVLFVPWNRGAVVRTREFEIRSLPVMTPLANACFGKERGCAIRFGEKTLRILDVK